MCIRLHKNDSALCLSKLEAWLRKAKEDYQDWWESNDAWLLLHSIPFPMLAQSSSNKAIINSKYCVGEPHNESESETRFMSEKMIWRQIWHQLVLALQNQRRETNRAE